MKLLPALVGVSVCIVASGADGDPVLSFNSDVRPILAEKCLHCHGPDEQARRAGLRLDSAASAFDDGRGTPAIVPGRPEQSALMHRITAEDDALRMPPAGEARQLSAAEIALLERWIAGGAVFEEHWAFRPPERPEPPPVRRTGWPRNAIDHFVLDRLERERLEPAPEAERVTLLRRVTLDLTGLPPTLDEVEGFLADESAGAYERTVDRLLASPRYGERMAQMWLDAARFADSGGYQGDILRSMWPWRDWVIAAYNANLPYDRFTVEQLAGDLLPEATDSQRIATGFNRNHRINDEDGIILEEFRVEYVVDRVETTATVWLGLTMGCARCHDHKYDPVTQREFFQLYAYFNSVAEEGRGHGNAPPLLRVPTPDGKEATLMVMQDLPEPRETFVLVRGAYDQPGEKVSPGVPAVLPPLPDDAPPNRLGLARWIVDPANPLTARVAVNRYWQMYFGAGLVATPEDFGTQGRPPTHPELLDWLATEFVRSGWDVKAMQRLIVTSATYRQSSAGNEALYERDPQNRLLARGPRFRMPFELIRDQALAAAELLHERLGGPSVRPYQPEGLWRELASADLDYGQSQGPDLYRRSLYTFIRRTVAPPSMTTFDAPNREICTVRRPRTNTPLQALVLMNDPTFVEASRVLAERILSNGGGEPAERLERLFRLLLARRPTHEEERVLLRTLEHFRQRYAEDAESARRLVSVGESAPDPRLDHCELAAYTAVAGLVMNLDEIITKE